MRHRWFGNNRLQAAQDALCDAAMGCAPCSSPRLLRAAQEYRDAVRAYEHRAAIGQLAAGLLAVTRAINTSERLEGVALELKISAGHKLSRTLRKRIKARGGSYTDVRGNTSERYLTLPAAAVELAEGMKPSVIILRLAADVARALSQRDRVYYPQKHGITAGITAADVVEEFRALVGVGS